MRKAVIKCLQTFFIGAFILSTGLAELAVVLINEPYNLGTSQDKIMRTFVETILILWIGSGFWIALYGTFVKCDKEGTIEEDDPIAEDNTDGLQ